jgi:uncharacterized DUF497 family protein
VKVSFDPVKSEKNRLTRNLPFESAVDFEMTTARIKLVERHGEQRLTAIGMYDQRVHFLCFQPTAEGFRVISFRLASRKERREYEDYRKVLGHDRH